MISSMYTYTPERSLRMKSRGGKGGGGGMDDSGIC